MAIAAVVLLAITRPNGCASIGRPALVGTLVLGTATAVLMLAYIEAIARIPLGTTAAIEFLGPLGVAAARSHRRSALVWPGLAFLGVVGLTEPWRGDVNLVGIGFAVLAAAGWAAYIVFTPAGRRRGRGAAGTRPVAHRRLDRRRAGRGLAGDPRSDAVIGLECVGLAVLVPLLPFSLELMALRRMRVAAFGTLMALEPGIAVVIGLVLLSQLPAAVQIAGVALVVVAGVGAQRGPRPQPEPVVPLSTTGGLVEPVTSGAT